MDTHDLEDTVVAILDAEPAVADAFTRLGAACYDHQVLAGEEGRTHLDPRGRGRRGVFDQARPRDPG